VAAEARATARPGRRRGRSRGDLKEQAILDTAWQLLADKPLSAIGIEDLARGAGISRPTFYFYFESREAVIRALGEVVLGNLRTALDEPAPADATALDHLRSRLRTYLTAWVEQGPVLRAMVPLYESDPELRAFWDGVTDAFVAGFADAIETERTAGRALPGPPAADDLARALVAMFWRSGYDLSLRPTDDQAAEAERLVETLAQVNHRAIFGR
jgi:TetR/AcrR family transcriptional regulator, ethionamide resistance regulator